MPVLTCSPIVMMPSLISIIMPVYNGQRYIRQAVDSVLAQTHPHWELIIVDDGSTDETSAIASSYNDRRIRYSRQENRGQAAALNRGLDLACGEYVTTLDADDYLPENSLGDRFNRMEGDPRCVVAYGDGIYCDESGSALSRFSQQMPAGVSGDVYDSLIVSPFYGTGASVMVRRDALLTYGLRYDETIVWCQDWDFYIRLAERASFSYVAAITIHYRLHAEGMTVALPTELRLGSLIKVRTKVLESPRFRSVSERQKAAFFYDFLVRDLQGKSFLREEIAGKRQFLSLSRRARARLLRYVGINCLVQEGNPADARRWLYASWRQNLLEFKTILSVVLLSADCNLARNILTYWQRSRGAEASPRPHDVALAFMGPGSLGKEAQS